MEREAPLPVSERRQFQRATLLKAAQVHCPPLRLPCSMRNVSATGMGIRLLVPMKLPDVVDIVVADEKTAYPMRVRWAAGADVGLQFLGDVAFRPPPLETAKTDLELRSYTEIDPAAAPPPPEFDHFGSRAADLLNSVIQHLRRSH